MFSSWILVAIIQIQWVLALENYPNSDKRKLCSPVGATIDIKTPICIPSGPLGDKWEQSSLDSCTGLLKQQCPEFNQAECVWQPLSFNELNVGYDCAGATNILFPACRLKYYASLHGSASKKTWMEIVYVNQYGTTLQNNTDYYIIEIHRWVRDGAVEYFGDVKEPDYPISAPNSKQPGGYDWNTAEYILDKSVITNNPLCAGGNDVDSFCSKTIHDAYITLISSPINPSNVISICSSEVKMDEQTNTLIKQDVCKITEKNTSAKTNKDLYSVRVCKATKGKVQRKNVTINLLCKTQRSYEDDYGNSYWGK